MAGPTQYGFDLRELAVALIKEQNIRDGKWFAAIEFGLGTGLFGPTPADSFPGGFIQVKRILLAQADSATPERFIVDAARVNPPPSAQTRTARSK
jgi:hypothetical protein